MDVMMPMLGDSVVVDSKYPGTVSGSPVVIQEQTGDWEMRVPVRLERGFYSEGRDRFEQHIIPRLENVVVVKPIDMLELV